MEPELSTLLTELAASGQTITYGALARDLAIPGPGAIAKLTAALERLMEADAALHHPFRAAVTCGRLNGKLPAQGFFDKAAQLGRYTGQDPAAYIAAERQALQAFTLAQISHGGRVCAANPCGGVKPPLFLSPAKPPKSQP